MMWFIFGLVAGFIVSVALLIPFLTYTTERP